MLITSQHPKNADNPLKRRSTETHSNHNIKQCKWENPVYLPRCFHCACYGCPCGRGHRNLCKLLRRRKADRPWIQADSLGPCAHFPPKTKINYRYLGLKVSDFGLCEPQLHLWLRKWLESTSLPRKRATLWLHVSKTVTSAGAKMSLNNKSILFTVLSQSLFYVHSSGRNETTSWHRKGAVF